MKSFRLKDQYTKFIVIVAVTIMVLVLSGITKASISQHLGSQLFPDLSNIQGKHIFENLP